MIISKKNSATGAIFPNAMVYYDITLQKKTTLKD